jgi:hypothetical protein
MYWLRILLIFALGVTGAHGNSTQQQLQQQITELEAVRTVTIEARDAALRTGWGATDTAVSRDAWNTYFGLLLGRTENIQAFQTAVEQAEIAYESHNYVWAASKTKEAIKQLIGLVQTQRLAIPKMPTTLKESLEFAKGVLEKAHQVGSDGKSLLQGLGVAGEAFQKSENLNVIIAKIDKQISDLFDQMGAAPYAPPVTPPPPPAPPPPPPPPRPPDTVLPPDNKPQDTVLPPDNTPTKPPDTVLAPDNTPTKPPDTVPPPDNTPTKPPDTVPPPDNPATKPPDTVLPPGQTVPTVSNGWCNGALCEDWYNGGDRQAFGDPANTNPVATAAAAAARQQFYDQNPQLVPLQSIAADHSPQSEVDEAVQKGLLSNSVPDQTETPSSGTNPLSGSTDGQSSITSRSGLMEQLGLGSSGQNSQAFDQTVQPSDLSSRRSLLDEGKIQLDEGSSGTMGPEGTLNTSPYVITEPARPSEIARMDRPAKTETQSGGTGGGFWSKLGNIIENTDWLKVAQVVAQTYDAFHPPTYAAPPAPPTRPITPNGPQTLGLRPSPQVPPAKPGTPSTPTKPTPTPTTPTVPTGTTSTPQPAPQNCSGGHCCPAPYHVNQAFWDCLAAPPMINGVPNYCDHNPDGSYVQPCK